MDTSLSPDFLDYAATLVIGFQRQYTYEQYRQMLTGKDPKTKKRNKKSRALYRRAKRFKNNCDLLNVVPYKQ